MKAIIFGAGRQAEGIAWYLVNHTDFDEVGIYSRTPKSIDTLIDRLDSDILVKHVGDVLDTNRTLDVMKDHDVGINALPTRKTSYATVELAAKAGLDMVDILEDYHRNPDPYEIEGISIPPGMSVSDYGGYLHQAYIDADIMLLDGMGFAPGITNFTLGEALSHMDTPLTAIARCGGIPDEASAKRHPLKYMITWSFEHVLREYNIKSSAFKDGDLVELEALSLQENFLFDRFGKNLELECAVTPGMPSFLHTHPFLKDTYEKTIRWPGHYDTIREFKRCGLLELEPVEIDEKSIVPRDLLSAVLTPRLKPLEGDRDCCVMWNTASGIKDGREVKVDIFMWDDEDVENGLTAMQRATCFPAAIAAEMIGCGELSGKGIVAPESCVTGDIYRIVIERLAKVGIEILVEDPI